MTLLRDVNKLKLGRFLALFVAFSTEVDPNEIIIAISELNKIEGDFSGIENAKHLVTAYQH